MQINTNYVTILESMKLMTINEKVFKYMKLHKSFTFVFRAIFANKWKI